MSLAASLYLLNVAPTLRATQGKHPEFMYGCTTSKSILGIVFQVSWCSFTAQGSPPQHCSVVAKSAVALSYVIFVKVKGYALAQLAKRTAVFHKVEAHARARRL